MRYEDKRVNDTRIVYIGSGFRGWARTFMTDLTMESSTSGTTRLYNIGTEASMANEITGNRLSQHPKATGRRTYEACISLEEVLTGVDFVVTSILPSTSGEMMVDVHMPEHLGVYQSVGDIAGPGSMIRTLRIIPMYVELAKAVRDYAPRTWVISYTNPMSLCIKALYHVFPQIKAFDYCHEVLGIQKVPKGLLGNTMGLEDVNRKDIRMNVLGTNHFIWFDCASCRGIDLFPMYRKYVDEHFEEGYAEHNTNQANACFACAYGVKFDLLRRYGLIAAVSDRHLAEFIPEDEYLKDSEAVACRKFGLASVGWWRGDLEKCMEKSRKLLCGETETDLKPIGEEGILLIRALCGLERVVSSVDMPDTGLQVPNLPAGVAVETNAVFRRDVVRSMLAGNVPELVKALIIPAVKNHETILEVALTCDEGLVVQAFMNDPQIRGRDCRKEDTRKLVRDMVEGTIKYLPEAWAVRK